MEVIVKVMNLIGPLIALMALFLFLPPFYVYKFIHFTLSSIFPENMTNKVVIITGASSGIGEHLAYEYAKRGAILVLVARRVKSLEVVAETCQGMGSPTVLIVPADVSKPDDCRRFIDSTISNFGRLDQLVNNAGIGSVGLVEEISDVTRLRASMASKGALISLYDTLRMEFGNDIEITIIAPGVIESEMTKGKFFTSEGKMEVDQDLRDAIYGLVAVETTKDFAKTVMKHICSGAQYIIEPRWWYAVYLYRVFLPEVVDLFQRFLYALSPHVPATSSLMKRMVDYLGVKSVFYMHAMLSPEIKRE